MRAPLEERQRAVEQLRTQRRHRRRARRGRGAHVRVARRGHLPRRPLAREPVVAGRSVRASPLRVRLGLELGLEAQHLLRPPLAAARALLDQELKLRERERARFGHLRRAVGGVSLEDRKALRRLDGAQCLGRLVTSDGILRAVFEQAGEKLDGAQHLHLPEGVRDLVPQQHRPSAVEEVHERWHSALICPVAQHKDLLVLFAAALEGLLGALDGARHVYHGEAGCLVGAHVATGTVPGVLAIRSR